MNNLSKIDQILNNFNQSEILKLVYYLFVKKINQNNLDEYLIDENPSFISKIKALFQQKDFSSKEIIEQIRQHEIIERLMLGLEAKADLLSTAGEQAGA